MAGNGRCGKPGTAPPLSRYGAIPYAFGYLRTSQAAEHQATSASGNVSHETDSRQRIEPKAATRRPGFQTRAPNDLSMSLTFGRNFSPFARPVCLLPSCRHLQQHNQPQQNQRCASDHHAESHACPHLRRRSRLLPGQLPRFRVRGRPAPKLAASTPAIPAAIPVTPCSHACAGMQKQVRSVRHCFSAGSCEEVTACPCACQPHAD